MQMTELPIDRYDTLRSIRIKTGMTQQEAAQKIGIAHGTLRSWEKDSSKISWDYITKISEVYNVNHRFIFFGKESTFSELIMKSMKSA